MKGHKIMDYYLIDYENTGENGLRGITELGEDSCTVIFYSENADKISFDMHQKLRECRTAIEYRKISTGKKNALDFQLSTYLGYLIAKCEDDRFYIVSKDSGYRVVLDFWKDKDVKQIDRIALGISKGMLPETIDCFIMPVPGNDGKQVPGQPEEAGSLEQEPAPDQWSAPADLSVMEPEAVVAAETDGFAAEGLEDQTQVPPENAGSVADENTKKPSRYHRSRHRRKEEALNETGKEGAAAEKGLGGEGEKTPSGSSQKDNGHNQLVENTPLSGQDQTSGQGEPNGQVQVNKQSEPNGQDQPNGQGRCNESVPSDMDTQPAGSIQPKETDLGQPQPRTQPSGESLRELVAQVVSDDKEQENICRFITKYKTKQGVNNALVKLYGSEKAGELYKKIKPLIKDKKGK